MLLNQTHIHISSDQSFVSQLRIGETIETLLTINSLTPSVHPKAYFRHMPAIPISVFKPPKAPRGSHYVGNSSKMGPMLTADQCCVLNMVSRQEGEWWSSSRKLYRESSSAHIQRCVLPHGLYSTDSCFSKIKQVIPSLRFLEKWQTQLYVRYGN